MHPPKRRNSEYLLLYRYRRSLLSAVKNDLLVREIVSRLPIKKPGRSYFYAGCSKLGDHLATDWIILNKYVIYLKFGVYLEHWFFRVVIAGSYFGKTL